MSPKRPRQVCTCGCPLHHRDFVRGYCPACGEIVGGDDDWDPDER